MRPRGLYQPFKHGTEELLNKHLLLIVVKTGQLSPEGLAEEVCFHPGTLHQDFLIVEHLEEQHLLSAESYWLKWTTNVVGKALEMHHTHKNIFFSIFLYIFCEFCSNININITCQHFKYISAKQSMYFWQNVIILILL